jgi:hypothetical protein
MSSLWTPGGEHRVPREQAEPRPTEGPPPGTAPAGRRDGYDPSVEGHRQGGTAGAEGGPSEEELRRLTEELAAAPAEAVVANHCYGLFELGALHLSLSPPQLDKARLAIDSLGLLVEGLGERLGQFGPDLAEGLNQLRLAYVRVAEASQGGASAPPSDE